MKNRLIVFTVALIVIGLSVSPLGAEEAAREGHGLEVVVEPGAHYSHWKWFGIFPVKLTPQIAVWVESEEGIFLQTLLVSQRGENNWRGADEGRPEALPVFTHRKGSAGLDDVTAATPKGKEAFSATPGEALSPGRYTVFAEVNSSFDYNDSYPEREGDVNGQPSLVYRGEVVLEEGPAEVLLEPVGTGALRGESGIIHPGVEGLTSALAILSKIVVKGN